MYKRLSYLRGANSTIVDHTDLAFLLLEDVVNSFTSSIIISYSILLLDLFPSLSSILLETEKVFFQLEIMERSDIIPPLHQYHQYAFVLYKKQVYKKHEAQIKQKLRNI